MMQVSRITAKYQITLPAAIREILHVEAGDRILFQVRDSGEIVIRPLKKVEAKDLAGSLHRNDVKYIPFDEARRITQEELGSRLSRQEDVEK
ncbi:MAG: type II toxin-antitoxin system PrlF family antitoxin [Alicyclobacillaceae bacterium]|nr:type II toxin-antitoxin system PrlF family antitoxin [Alicyclobacillaceae bacterium]